MVATIIRTEEGNVVNLVKRFIFLTTKRPNNQTILYQTLQI